MKQYRKPARKQRPVCDLRGRKDRLPARESILVAVQGEVPLSDEGNVAQRMPGALAYVLDVDGSWSALCKRLGLGWRRVQDFDGGAGRTTPKMRKRFAALPPAEHDPVVAVEVWGAGPALDATMNHSDLVTRWEYRIIAAHEPMSSVGPPTRPATSKPKAKPPSDGGAFREMDAARKAASEPWDAWLTRQGMQGVKID